MPTCRNPALILSGMQHGLLVSSACVAVFGNGSETRPDHPRRHQRSAETRADRRCERSPSLSEITAEASVEIGKPCSAKRSARRQSRQPSLMSASHRAERRAHGPADASSRAIGQPNCHRNHERWLDHQVSRCSQAKPRHTNNCAIPGIQLAQQRCQKAVADQPGTARTSATNTRRAADSPCAPAPRPAKPKQQPRSIGSPRSSSPPPSMRAAQPNELADHAPATQPAQRQPPKDQHVRGMTCGLNHASCRAARTRPGKENGSSRQLTADRAFLRESRRSPRSGAFERFRSKKT